MSHCASAARRSPSACSAAARSAPAKLERRHERAGLDFLARAASRRRAASTWIGRGLPPFAPVPANVPLPVWTRAGVDDVRAAAALQARRRCRRARAMQLRVAASRALRRATPAAAARRARCSSFASSSAPIAPTGAMPSIRFVFAPARRGFDRIERGHRRARARRSSRRRRATCSSARAKM